VTSPNIKRKRVTPRFVKADENAVMPCDPHILAAVDATTA